MAKVVITIKSANSGKSDTLVKTGDFAVTPDGVLSAFRLGFYDKYATVSKSFYHSIGTFEHVAASQNFAIGTILKKNLHKEVVDTFMCTAQFK